MHFNQLFKRLWTHRIKLTVVFDLLVFSLSLSLSCKSFFLLIYYNMYISIRMSYAQICTCSNRICYLLWYIYHPHTYWKCNHQFEHPKIFSHIFFSVCLWINSVLRSALSSAVYYWILWFSSPNDWRAMLICFELLILCLCFDVKIAFSRDFQSL